MQLSMNPAIIVLNGKLTPPLPSWRYSTSLASHTNCHYRHPLISHGTRYLYIILHVPKRDIATRQNETIIFQGALHNGKVTSLVQTNNELFALQLQPYHTTRGFYLDWTSASGLSFKW